MTEDGWMACGEPQDMLENLGNRSCDRTLRLFGCACLRLESWGRDERLQSIVSTAERYADHKASNDELSDAWNRGNNLLPPTANTFLPNLPMRDALSLATQSANVLFFRYFMRRPFEEGLGVERRHVICGLLRCIFGNPFRPSSDIIVDALTWNDATVRRIAECIYADHAFDRLPILADALLDAGCDDEALIGHCRSAGPHARGCWAADLVLGKKT